MIYIIYECSIRTALEWNGNFHQSCEFFLSPLLFSFKYFIYYIIVKDSFNDNNAINGIKIDYN